jgi:hypothetical protein
VLSGYLPKRADDSAVPYVLSLGRSEEA